jgi:hypothetical protein
LFPQYKAPYAKVVLRRPCKIAGLTKLLGGLLALVAFSASAPAANVVLAWNASTNLDVAGYNVYYGQASQSYTASVNAGTNLTETFANLTPGLTYYFAATAYDANGDESAFSNEATNMIPLPLSILTQPQSETVIAASAASFSSAEAGPVPLFIQWYFGTTAIAGATNSALAWASVTASNAGNYYLTVSNVTGVVTSSVATLTVLTPPSILTEPKSQTVIATTAASFSSVATGTAPLSIQWYFGTTALAGATNSILSWASVAASNAGNYYLTVSNAAGVAASSSATLTVLPTNTIASVAGVYNGLFFQTNANGAQEITETTAGFLGNCVVASNGIYSAKLYLGGQSCSLAGTFNASGTASNTIPITGPGLSNVTVVLQLDLFNGTRQITGAVSNAAASNAWSAPLLGDLATNAFPMLTGASLLFSPGSSTNSPTNSGVATGLVANSVLSLSGVLGDAAAFSQTVPISTEGNVPIYVNLYTNGGLLEGWINLAGTSPVGNLTWVRPGGVLVPAGFLQGFNTVVKVSGATYQQAVGSMGTSGPGTYTFAYSTSSTSGWIVFQDSNGNQHFEKTGANISFNATGSLTFWSCVGTNNPTPSGVITALITASSGNNPTLLSLNISNLAGLQTFMIENQDSITSINASGCLSLTSFSCNEIPLGTVINVSNCASLTNLSNLTSDATVADQNAIIATLPTFATGTHTLYWSEYAPANPAGDAAAVAKGWIVNRKTS